MAIYACLWSIYAYCKPCKHIYMTYIYVCHVCLYVFMPFACYMCANGCKLVQMYAPLHINDLMTSIAIIVMVKATLAIGML